VSVSVKHVDHCAWLEEAVSGRGDASARENESGTSSRRMQRMKSYGGDARLLKCEVEEA